MSWRYGYYFEKEVTAYTNDCRCRFSWACKAPAATYLTTLDGYDYQHDGKEFGRAFPKGLQELDCSTAL